MIIEREFYKERESMVKEQLVPRGISDINVLDAFNKVPRHKFMQKDHVKAAYGDHPVDIGEGQTISQPYMAAIMSESLRLKKTDRVLEIGTGSGYQTAIITELVASVYTMERLTALSKRAQVIFNKLGYKNIKLKVGDGSQGWSEFAPYDAIIVTCAAPSIPEPLRDQLKEGGRMAIPIGVSFSQVLTLVRKEKNKLKEQNLCNCVFVPLLGKYGWKR